MIWMFTVYYYCLQPARQIHMLNPNLLKEVAAFGSWLDHDGDLMIETDALVKETLKN